ncbi:MAG: uridine kinase [Bacteroidaceae bacterium]|nr:uridine kinase [Bacteroidaceae bacterium]
MFIIGIAGGTGSGKTTVVRKIVAELTDGKVAVIPQDSYYKAAEPGVPLEVLQKKNFDHPDAFDWELLFEQIKQLRAGQAIEQPKYSFLKCDREEETVHVEPTRVVIIEGIMALYKKELRDMMDLRIYVDADPDERLIRVIERDVIERGRTARDVMNRYRSVLKPMHREFIEPTKEYADLIIPRGGDNVRAIQMVRSYIRRKIGQEE